MGFRGTGCNIQTTDVNFREEAHIQQQRLHSTWSNALSTGICAVVYFLCKVDCTAPWLKPKFPQNS